jgi:hypothetical protein
VSRKHKVAAIAIALAVPILGMTALASPAMAVPNGYFKLVSQAATGSCVEAAGSAVEIVSCGPSYSAAELWVAGEGDSNEIANDATGACLSITGTDAGVYLNGCDPGASAQEWIPSGGEYGILLENNHTHYCLWQSNSSLQQRSDCDTTNVHDQWSEIPES